jgi:hypothetical protein
LNDIILILEIAELSIKSESIANVIGLQSEDRNQETKYSVYSKPSMSDNTRMSTARWSEVRFKPEDDTSQLGSDIDLRARDAEKALNAKEVTGFNDFETEEAETASARTGFYGSSSHLPILELLDKWDDPINEQDKACCVLVRGQATFLTLYVLTFSVPLVIQPESNEASVSDILKFRKALTYMNIEIPFSEAFGKASRRHEMIVSAEDVYNCLLKLSSGEDDALPGLVFQILYLNEDGSEDKVKKRALGNLLQPDWHDNIQFVSFIQSCDIVYRKLRYFRASVGNSSVIDHFLERIIDSVFFSALGLIVLDMLKLNPWPLLVSTSSTLLVAGSFAEGPSCAKAVEVRCCLPQFLAAWCHVYHLTFSHLPPPSRISL